MSNGKHFSSGEQRAMAPRPVVPAAGRTHTAHGAHRAQASAGSARRASQPGSPRGPRRLRPAAIAALAAALVVVAVAGVIAWTTAQDALTNTFGLGKVDTAIVEKFDGETKENVYATNNGNVPAYIRAQVNIYWIDAETGEQLWDVPQQNTDYTVIPANDGWKIDQTTGFYYWTKPVRVGDKTGKLIDKISQSDTQLAADKDAGRKLVVDVDIQAIQADPTNAVTEAWGVTLDADGTITDFGN